MIRSRAHALTLPLGLSLGLSLALMLAACGRAPDDDAQLNALDNELSAVHDGQPARDPKLAEALAGQILVDPGLTQTSNANAVRPPDRPVTDQVPTLPPPADPVDGRTLKTAPAATHDCSECRASKNALTLAALAGQQARNAQCLSGLRYSAGWANRMPPVFPVYPGSQLSEAAGNDAGGCAFRIVSFRAGGAADKVVNFYYSRAVAAGFDADHKRDGAQHVLGGSRQAAAYMIYATDRPDGGSDVDLIVRGG
ncbi:hypothetical protein RN629_03835 [Sphingomonadaceae bacterium jetA1]|uniref:hypothetical protein n=1 Tax=Facivitalis istanbulensis TaxID=3075838 RepID=UPI0034983077